MSTITPTPSSKKCPSLPFATRLSISFLSAATDIASRRDGTVNRRLLALVDPPTPPNPKPIRGVKTFDIIVDANRDLWLRLFVPTTATATYTSTNYRLPVIVFFHGGGFVFLNPAARAYDELCRRLARHIPVVIASVNYRLAPENKCPAAYVDGLDFLRFLDSNNISHIANAVDLSSCFLVGDSAGGNIVHHVARSWARECNSWRRVRVVGIVAIQPYFGGKERTESERRLKKAPLVTAKRTDWLWKAFLPEGADRDHEASNVLGPRDTTELEEEFPPAMVVVGGWDPLKDWQRRYVEGLRRRGKEVRLVEYERAVHAFYVFPNLKDAKLVMEEIKSFVESHRNKRT